MKLIIAMSENGVIGKDNTLPWGKLPDDMKWFKSKTRDSIVVMGRKTHESIGKPLPDRHNVVITTKPQSIDGVTVISLDPDTDGNMLSNGVDIMVEAIRAIEQDTGKEAVVIGGKSIYERLLPYVSDIYLTIIRERHDGDTVMDLTRLIDGFTLTSTIDLEQREDRLGMMFQTYRRK